jgi:hypothetical protein
LAVVCSYAFFFEYLPPVQQVQIPYDLGGFHYPLAEYAFQQLKHGHWPQWDVNVYSGMSFAANVTVALYYPGTWMMFAANWWRERLSFQSLQDLNLLHVPLAFTLCFFWLRRKGLRDMSSAMGAMVYASGGYLCSQLQHFGLVVTYAWIPLALLGIDEAAESKSWRPLWKVAVASALGFLGGYPPTWLVMAVVVGVYALASPGRWKTAPGVIAALVFSLALCAAQILPTWEATHFREPELRYGVGIKDPMYFLSFLVPNYFNFGLDAPLTTSLGKEYLYLGAPGILGIALAFWSRRWKLVLPGLAMVVATLIVVVNPYAIVWNSIKFSSVLADVMRSAYFMAGVIPGMALLAAVGIDDFLRRKGARVPAWAAFAAIVALAGYELSRWFGPGFASGPLSAVNTVLALAVFSLGLFALRTASGNRAAWLGIALLLSVGIDYKVFGTSTRQNSALVQGMEYSSTQFLGMNKEAYLETLRYPDYRVVLHELGPMSADLRHVGWKSPQGFDPFLSIAYRKLITRDGTFTSDREWLLDPTRLEVMQRFGARFVFTAEPGSKYKELVAHPRYRMVGVNDSYYKVFEYLDAKPIYGFPGQVDVMKRDPEHRVLKVSSEQGGLFTFAEQAYPGWSATVDGQPAAIEPWEIAFQSVRVPAGAHTVEFVYRERLLSAGLGVSVVSLALLAWWIRASSKSTYSRANPAVSG